MGSGWGLPEDLKAKEPVIWTWLRLRALPFGFFPGVKSRVFFIFLETIVGKGKPAREYTKSRTVGLNHSAAL
jgi:hypothetical protein